ncbi:tetratricopeptide repeat protein [bacterium]|nr:tetratricopeptide repeat protein [bacterium]
MRKVLLIILIICLFFVWMKNFIESGKLLVYLDKHPHEVWTPRCLYFVGNTYFFVRNYENAIVYFKRIINKYPKIEKIIDVEYMLGRSYESTNRYKEAKEVYRGILEKYPKNDYRTVIEKKMQLIFN